MTAVPTPDELDDLWAGTYAPPEPSPTIHPAMLPADRQLAQHPTHDLQINARHGVYEISDEARTWRIVSGTIEQAFQVYKAIAVGIDLSVPRAETQGHPVPDSDPLAPARGILLATAIMALVYAGVFAVLRWRGVL